MLPTGVVGVITVGVDGRAREIGESEQFPSSRGLPARESSQAMRIPVIVRFKVAVSVPQRVCCS